MDIWLYNNKVLLSRQTTKGLCVCGLELFTLYYHYKRLFMKEDMTGKQPLCLYTM